MNKLKTLAHLMSDAREEIAIDRAETPALHSVTPSAVGFSVSKLAKTDKAVLAAAVPCGSKFP